MPFPFLLENQRCLLVTEQRIRLTCYFTAERPSRHPLR